jgi:FixJ family two-component response regulator
MRSGGGQLCVFVVDDETVIATAQAAILRMNGFQAYSFDKPLEALMSARETAPDLLLTDVVMPLISGIELAIRMWELCPNCKVLLFSGQAATVNLLEGARTTRHNFEMLVKPVHPAVLLKKVLAELAA